MRSAAPAYDLTECIPPKVLARRFSKSVSWLYTMARQGNVPAVRVGGSWLFPRLLIERWLEGAADAEMPGRRGRVDSLASGRRSRGSSRR